MIYIIRSKGVESQAKKKGWTYVEKLQGTKNDGDVQIVSTQRVSDLQF